MWHSSTCSCIVMFIFSEVMFINHSCILNRLVHGFLVVVVLQDGCGSEDWRKELLGAVEMIVEQEGRILSSALSSITPGNGEHDDRDSNSCKVSLVNYEAFQAQVITVHIH